MAKEFVIARNPDDDSALPYLLLIPIDDGIVLKTREMWPRTGKLYCHRADWVVEPEIIERVPVRSVVRRGAAIDLVLDRTRESRSQFVMTRIRGGREAVFWQTSRVAKQARPQVVFPSARASGVADLEIVIDSHERYAWKFSEQQATTVKRALRAGDYAVESDGEVIAAVERKNLDDLVSSLTSGKLRYQLADLAGLPRAAVVVEERYSSVFKLDFVRPAVVADLLGECQVRFPHVPIIFAETRKLAQEWTFRFFGAALNEHAQESESVRRVAGLRALGDVTALDPSEDVAGLDPSRDVTAPDPSADVTGPDPSADLTGPDPSPDVTGPDPSEDLAGPDPSEDLTAPDPSEDLTALDPSEDVTGPDPSPDVTGTDPSEDVTALDPSEDVTGLRDDDGSNTS